MRSRDLPRPSIVVAEILNGGVSDEAVPIPDEPSWEMLLALMERSGGSRDRTSTGIWALGVFRSILGEDWPERWHQRNGKLPNIVLNASMHSVSYWELTTLALRFHGCCQAPGFGQLRKDLRGNTEVPRLVHAQLQLEMAGLAKWNSIPYRLEMLKPDCGRPADISLWSGPSEIVVECFAIYRDELTRSDLAYDEAFGRAMNLITFERGVFLAGEMRERLSSQETEQLIADLAALAEKVQRDSTARSIYHRAGDFVVLPMQAAAGQTFRGPTSQGKGWPRDAGIIADKARDWIGSSDPVWLRCDLLDGLWAFSDWGQQPLAEKARQMEQLLRQALADLPVAGVVISSGAAMVLGQIIGESSFSETGTYGLRRQLAPFVARETIVVPLQPNSLSAARRWVDLYNREAFWLQAALEQAGLPWATS